MCIFRYVTRLSARHLVASLLAISCAAGPLQAQHAQPYAGFDNRDIKAMAPERIAGLLAAQGMGYAMTAELNGYPGPMHVLELAEQLKLTPAQAERARALMDSMKAEGRILGARLVEAEAHLERMFRMQHIDPARLREQTAAIGAIEADLRRAHLAAHLDMRAAMTPEQIANYDRLRGYGAGGHGQGHGGGHHAPTRH